ncbi:MAG: esterase-like activity of phytase family protein [Pseudomonadota bacterium]
MSLAAGALAAVVLAAHPGHADWTPVDITHGPAPFGALFIGREIGAFKLLAAIDLDAEERRFGGYSGLVVSKDGGRLIAVSDAGTWLAAEIDRSEAGAIIGLSNAVTAPILGEDDAPLTDKLSSDAESLTVTGRSVLIGFERRHRIQRHSLDTARYHHAGAVAVPEGLKDAPSNSGLESLVALEDGRLILLTERLRVEGEAGAVRGWIGGPAAWLPFAYRPAPEHAPTDAALSLDGTRLYVVERAYSQQKGVRIRITETPLANLIEGAVVEPLVLATLGVGAPVDNFEGLAVARGPDGGERLYLISDDNFSKRQNTLFLEFARPMSYQKEAEPELPDL